mgnify:CR=1 FL=1
MKLEAKLLLVLCTVVMLVIVYPLEVKAQAATSRLAGDDRFLTAVTVSKTGWPEGANTVILANGLNYPDALSAAPLAKKYDAPILLTRPDKLHPETAVEIKRLKAKKVILVGGNGVLSTNVLYELRLMGLEVARIAGENRYDTSLAVAEEVGLTKGIFVLSGSRFQDALSVSAIAASQGMPILFVPENDLTAKQKAAINNADLSKVIFVGADYDFNSQIYSYFPGYERIAGDDIYDRNVNLVKYFEKALNFNRVYIATAREFPDALAGSALAAKENSPLFLLNGNTVPGAVRIYFGERVINQMRILGGDKIISYETQYALSQLPAKFNDYRHINVTIKEKQSYQLPKTVTMKLSTGEWEEVPVTWGLSYVNTQRAGTYTFEGTVEGFGTVYLTLVIEPIPSKVQPITAEIIKGDTYFFPDSLPVIMSDESVQYHPVIWSTNAVTMNKTGNYSYQGTVEGTNLKATVNLKVSEDSVVTFADVHLEAAVRQAVSKNNNLPIYKSDILRLISLNARGCGITDLKGIEGFTNLQYLYLDSNALTTSSLSPLQNLMNLRYLELQYNQIDQVSALQKMANLAYLDIRYNQIKDFTPLKGLTSLRTLYLLGNATTDYSPLRQIYINLSYKDFSY